MSEELKLCINCRFSYRKLGYHYYRCKKSVEKYGTVDIVTGKISPDTHFSCNMARGDYGEHGECGKRGKNYSPRDSILERVKSCLSKLF